MRSSRFVPMLVLSLLVAVVEARATTFVPITTADLARHSDRVLVGTVVGTEARWERGRIVTRVVLRSEEANELVSFEHPGGTVGGVTMRVIGMPSFVARERVVVMVVGRYAKLRLVGLADGKLAVERRDGTDVVMMRVRNDGPAEPVSLHDGLRTLRAAARASFTN